MAHECDQISCSMRTHITHRSVSSYWFHYLFSSVINVTIKDRSHTEDQELLNNAVFICTRMEKSMTKFLTTVDSFHSFYFTVELPLTCSGRNSLIKYEILLKEQNVVQQ